MTIANYSTYFILIICLVLSINKPKTAFLLLIATEFTRISNILGVPRIFSPLFIEFILLFIIYFNLKKQINFLTIVKQSKLLFLWVVIHMLWRISQYLIYDDIIFLRLSGNMANFYFKILLFYLIAIHLLSMGNNFNKLTKYLTINLFFLVSFVYLEYFFYIEYGELYNTLIYYREGIARFRYSQRILYGPYEHWVLTGMVLVTYLPLLIYQFNKNINKTLLFITFLFITILLLGSRSATFSAFCLVSIYLVTKFNYKKGIIMFLLLLITPYLLISFSEIINYYQQSFSFSASSMNPGYNLTVRLYNTLLLIRNINTVPFFGFGYSIRPIDNYNVGEMPIKSGDMESNLFIQDIYDFGIIVGCITLIWFFSCALTGLKQQKEYNYASTLTWFGILIAGMSNINFTFSVMLVPITFYSWEKSKLLQKKLYPNHHL